MNEMGSLEQKIGDECAKEGRAFKTFRLASSCAATGATAYLFLSSTDISRFDFDTLDFVAQPGKTALLVSLPITAGYLTNKAIEYCSSLSIVKKAKAVFKSRLAKFGAALSIMGIIGSSYISDGSRYQGVVRPVRLIKDTASSITARNPARERNLNYIRNYAVPILQEIIPQDAIPHEYHSHQEELQETIHEREAARGLCGGLPSYVEIAHTSIELNSHPDLKGASRVFVSDRGDMFQCVLSPVKDSYREVEIRVRKSGENRLSFGTPIRCIPPDHNSPITYKETGWKFYYATTDGKNISVFRADETGHVEPVEEEDANYRCFVRPVK